MKENKKIPPKQTAENIPEVEHSEIPTSNEETISAEENILPEIEQSEIPPLSGTEIIETSNTATKNDMEVHHHTHPDSHRNHGKKNWKSYFWEFFMLFMAVSAGFLVENQREHYVEYKRAKVFARLLIDDLAADTSELNRASRVLNKIIVAGDSLGRLLNTNDIKTIPGGKLYYYEYWSGWRWSVISRDATLQQLKNSGALRYLGDTSIIRKILNYEESIRVISMLQNKYEPEKIQNWNLVQKVFDQGYFNVLDSIAPRDSTTKHFEMNDQKLSAFLNSNFPLYTYDKNVLMELRNWAYNSSRNYKVTVHDIRTAKEKAYRVIEALKKEYHLE